MHFTIIFGETLGDAQTLLWTYIKRSHESVLVTRFSKNGEYANYSLSQFNIFPGIFKTINDVEIVALIVVLASIQIVKFFFLSQLPKILGRWNTKLKHLLSYFVRCIDFCWLFFTIKFIEITKCRSCWYNDYEYDDTDTHIYYLKWIEYLFKFSVW